MPLITNGGDHSAESLAMSTAEQLLASDPAVVDGQVMLHAATRLAIGRALVSAHENVRAAHLAALEASPEEFGCDHQVDTTEALNAVRAAVAETPWADAFTGEEAERRARSILETQFRTTMHTARQVAAKASDAPEAAAFLDQHHGG